MSLALKIGIDSTDILAEFDRLKAELEARTDRTKMGIRDTLNSSLSALRIITDLTTIFNISFAQDIDAQFFALAEVGLASILEFAAIAQGLFATGIGIPRAVFLVGRVIPLLAQLLTAQQAIQRSLQASIDRQMSQRFDQTLDGLNFNA